MKILPEVSRTLSEYLLLPGLTTEDCTPDNVLLDAPLVRHRVGEEPGIRIATPMVSAIMQAVSSPSLAVALAQVGGMSFIHQNQQIEDQAADVRAVKRHRAGFRACEVVVAPQTPLGDVARQLAQTEHGVAVVTQDGTTGSAFLGLISPDDFHLQRHGSSETAGSRMRERGSLVTAPSTVSLSEANELIWEHHQDVLPVLGENGEVVSLVLKRDYQAHKTFHHASVDGDKRLRVGAGINSRDFKDRIPALLEAGVDVLCLDSSDGYSVYQGNVLEFVKEKYGESVFVGAGNVVDGRAFRYLADAGAAFVKVGIGGGAICTTREQKGIGRGQASALLDVVAARDLYAQETGTYVPLCCDGGLLNDSHMALALAMGADFIMLGRYFARLDESPSRKLQIDGQWYKEYWGEGSRRAQNAARYGQRGQMAFEEGVDGYVPYAGSLYDNVARTRAKLTATMISCGSTNLPDFHRDAVMVEVSAESMRQTGAEIAVRRPAIDAGE
ncbi:IMP dehydrogenase [Streptomyces chartreusis]